MNRRFVLPASILLAALLVGCGASPRRFGPRDYGMNGGGSGQGSTGTGTGTNGSQGGSGLGNAPRAGGDARTTLNNLAQAIQAQGGSLVGAAVHGELPPNGLVAYAINTQPGVCYTVAVIGETSSDINLYVLDNAGATVGYDVRPDGHPWASFCPSAAGRAIARLQMARGTGGYYYVAFQSPAQRGQVDLATFFGGGGSEQGPSTAAVDANTQARLTALDQRLASDRFTRLGPPTGLQLNPQTTRDFVLNLQAGTCYAFATFGGQGATDTDATLLDGAGTTLESDTGRDVDALVRYCAPTTGRYTLQTRMWSGAAPSPMFTVGYVQGAATNPTTTGGGQVLASTSTAGAGLEENFSLLDGDMRARGYEPLGEQVRGSLAEHESRDFEISFEGGKCYAVLAVGDNGVRDLDLRLLDARGNVMDRDVQADPRPIVRVCPEQSGSFRMQAAMATGGGNFVYAAYRWPRGTRGPFGLRGLMYVRLAEVSQLLHVEGYEPDEAFSIERGTLRNQGDTRTHRFELQNGQCYSVLVVGGQGINDLDLSLSGNGAQVTDGSRNPFPNARLCAPQTGRFELTVRAADGAGDYAYQVFRRTGS